MRVGIDVGGSGMRAVVYDKRLKPVKQFFEPWKNPMYNISKKQLLSFIKKMKKYGSIGLGVAGFIRNKKVIDSPNIKGINGLSLSGYIVDNDVNMFAIAENKFGAGKTFRDSLYITVGTGLGGAIIIDNKLYKGNGMAGEFGHMTIKFNGRRCLCGRRGCLEEYVSKRAIQQFSRNYIGKVLDPKDVYLLARKGDRNAIKVFETAGEYLGIGLTNLSNILDPEAIIIGGGISGAFRFIMGGVKKTFNPVNKNVKILKSKLKHPVCLGAVISLGK